MPEFAAAPSEPTAPVAMWSDLFCRNCGSDLSGIGQNRHCPQCGTARGACPLGEWLRFSDPAWVRLLARGTELVLAGYGCTILGMIVTVICAMMMGPRGIVYGAVIIFAGTMQNVIGSWLLTERDPADAGNSQTGGVRTFVRLTLLFTAAQSVLNVATSDGSLPPENLWYVGVAGAVASLISIAGLAAQLQYLEKLSDRIPAPGISVRASSLKISLPLSQLGVLLSTAMFLYVHQADPTVRTPMGASCLGGISGICALIFGLQYLAMIFRLGQSFRAQATLAAKSVSTANGSTPAAPQPSA